jgi:hypothetical protein
MTSYVDHFECDNCQCRDFKRIYNFSLRFHGVNFSDDLIYDRVTDEIYECTQCKKRFSFDEIEKRMAMIRQEYRQKSFPES